MFAAHYKNLVTIQLRLIGGVLPNEIKTMKNKLFRTCCTNKKFVLTHKTFLLFMLANSKIDRKALQLESIWLDINNPFYFCNVKCFQVKPNIQQVKNVWKTWFYLSYNISQNYNKNRNYNIKRNVYEMKSGHYDKSQWDKKLSFYFISTDFLYHNYDLQFFKWWKWTSIKHTNSWQEKIVMLWKSVSM